MVEMVALVAVMVLRLQQEKVQEFPLFHGVTKQNMEDTLAAAVAEVLRLGVADIMAALVVPVAAVLEAVVTIMVMKRLVVIVLVLVPLIPVAAEAALVLLPLNGNIPVEMVAQAL